MRSAAIGLMMLSACGEPSKPAAPPLAAMAPPIARNLIRTEGLLYTGFPESTELAACDSRGRWGIGTPTVDHGLVDVESKTPYAASENSPRTGLYRGALPFPHTTWKAGPYEINQVVFPVGSGFAVRYHVMNHGDAARDCTLYLVPGTTPVVGSEPPAGKTVDRIAFDLRIEPGASRFLFVTTTDLAGKVPENALDDAAARWERILGGRGVDLPDRDVMSRYYAALAGKALGLSGFDADLSRIDLLLVRREGDALRLLADAPDPWQVETIEARAIPTDFGPLTFKYQGAYNNRAVEFQPGCSPPGGFLLALPDKLVAHVDGKAASAKDGVVRIPAGSKTVELSYPR